MSINSNDSQPADLGRIPLEALARRVGTPFHLCLASELASRIAHLQEKLESHGLKVRYAMKASSSGKVLTTVREAGFWIDALGANEILRARAAGFAGGTNPPEVLLTSDVFRDGSLEVLQSESILPNIGSPGMVEELVRSGLRGPIGLRINPGFGHGHVRACDTGGPSSKHGIWLDDEPRVRRAAAENGLEVVLLHAHVGTGSGIEEFQANMERLREFFLERIAEYPRLEAVNFGGGIPHPYRPGSPPVDLTALATVLCRARDEFEQRAGRPIRVEIEPGRYLVASSGLLVTRISDIKKTSTNEKGPGQTFVMVDAGFTELVRPAMYGAYHHISAPGRTVATDGKMEAVVAGPLCESGDVFTRDHDEFIEPRELPRVKSGDLLVIHDTGAYGVTMSSNYNSIGRAPQVWWEGGRAHLISRRETLEDLLRTECHEELRIDS